MHNRNIIVIGGSAGAVQPLTELLSALPEDFPAAVLAALHLSPLSAEWLSEYLRRSVRIAVQSPRDPLDIRNGQIVVARPDHHLVVIDGRVVSSRGPRENLWRPAIDVLFRTAAVAYGPRVVGVLLSGELDDGTAGLQAIKTCGGLVIVQSPDDAAHPAMPRIASANVHVDYCAALLELPELLGRLVQQPAGEGRAIPAELRKEASLALAPEEAVAWMPRLGPPSPHSCPECGGPLWEMGQHVHRYRCLVGHSFNAHSLLQGAEAEIDKTLWAAIRLFEQRVNISRMLAEQERSRGQGRRAELHDTRAREAREHAEKLRELHRVRATFSDAEDLQE